MTFIIICILLNLLFIFFNNKIAGFLNLYDKPDKIRKKHQSIVPLTGGVFIFLNIIFFLVFLFFEKSYLNKINVFFNNKDFFIFFIVLIIFFLIGFFDDKFEISANYKILFITPVLILTVILSEDLLIDVVTFTFFKKNYYLPFYVSVIWSVLCFLLFINALNMFDGINYQVGTYSIFLCIIFINYNYFTLFFIIFFISLIFFLLLNHQNKAFLGDSGTHVLAFVFGYFFIKFYNQTNYLKADQIVLLMIIPGIDLMRLFIYRIYKGLPPFQADRNHLHYVVLLKNNLLKTNLKILSLIIIPSLLSLFFGHTIIFVIIQLIIYFYFIAR